ncbi:MAG: exonuclease subunit SbcD [Saprospiraceae bacterium]
MKVLHTSDWHLGQKFLTKDRLEEHQLALDWMYELIIAEQVDVLIVAGDIFDIGSPPNYARKLYYSFLTRLLNTPCRHVVIIGGNHDSPTMLEAPKALLEQLNIHIIGAVPEDPKDQLITLKNKEGQPEGLIAAVPFLRDRDLRTSTTAETGLQRIEMIKKAITQHYVQIGEWVEALAPQDIPVIATGHLYASGAIASDKQDNIYIGDKENIKADQFPSCFDYVALGHIHRPQIIGDHSNVRYSGSIIPLSFSETKDDKSIYLLEFEAKTLKAIHPYPIPVFRRLKTIQGDYETVKEKLLTFAKRHEKELKAWLEVIVESKKVIPNLSLELNELVADLNVELLKVRVAKTAASEAKPKIQEELSDLEALDVFRKKCAVLGDLPDEINDLEHTFKELQNWMQENPLYED